MLVVTTRCDNNYCCHSSHEPLVEYSRMAKHGTTKHHAKQHFVAQCYTKPWCDSSSHGPKKTPYVWVFDKEGKSGRRKAPVNLFTETDIYTLTGPDRTRDLRLEHGLCELEDKFTRIRNTTFMKGVWPNAEEAGWIHAFISTAHTRTKAFRDFHRAQWGRLRRRMEEMEVAIKQATPEQRQAMSEASSFPGTESKARLTTTHVRRLEEAPLHPMLTQTLEIELPIMAKMSMAILHTDDPLGFVTSDNPVVYFDPTAYRRQPIYRSAGLMWKDIEVSMPISPSQCLVLSHHKEFAGFMKASPEAVSELNRLRIAFADESFVACMDATRPEWFIQTEMPDDAWEKVRERKIASGEWPAPHEPDENDREPGW